MDERDWERLIFQLTRGACTPFLGAGACAGVLPSGSELSENLADQWDYPYSDRGNLTRVSQYGTVKFGEAVYVKEQICEVLTTGKIPDFGDPAEPHGLLARFPIPVYLTTNYDDFIVRSLRAVGKDPSVMLCPWNPGIAFDEELFRRKISWNPQPDAPLVYHLHGRLGHPESIVVTEDDYLEFLTNLAFDRASDEPTMLPPVILGALTTRSLLFIGYSLQDWTFRLLFNSLNRAVPGINRRRHLSVQLSPEGGDAEVKILRRQMEQHYGEWKVSIFWGTADEFCKQLLGRLTT
ncbi:SIR2 family NAD-dependent protein deacylase [Herbidospora cretacea]|uniref:SIR2 family NAD-dependent protein deacylase n=1 Tax=Herbidospora cretacea TaxID=28444 RepID=UPI000AFE92D9|nr:SIR2 family protein [Herbidospora cretacea]